METDFNMTLIKIIKQIIETTDPKKKMEVVSRFMSLGLMRTILLNYHPDIKMKVSEGLEKREKERELSTNLISFIRSDALIYGVNQEKIDEFYMRSMSRMTDEEVSIVEAVREKRLDLGLTLEQIKSFHPDFKDVESLPNEKKEEESKELPKAPEKKPVQKTVNKKKPDPKKK